MKKCIVIGGGLAGLSAAVHLANNSVKVTLLEASPKLGGRAYSFYNDKHKHFVDNGQHIMMGCYDSTIELLNVISAGNEIIIQDKLCIHFVDKKGNIFKLDTGSDFYPFNLARAILNYKVLSVAERFSVLKFFINNIIYNAGINCDLSIADWLRKGGQSENSISALWGILAIGTLNSSIDKASAFLFRNVLRQIFFTGNKSSKIILPKNSLSETFSIKAGKFIQSNGGEISLSDRVESIYLEGEKISEIKTSKYNYNNFDYVISAVPVNSIDRINFFPYRPAFELPELPLSPILSVHLWLKDNPFKEMFYGFIDSKIHWLFNHRTHITLVTSSAGELINFENDKLINLFCLEIKKFFPYFDVIEIRDTLVIKEKSATFLPTIASNSERSKIFNPLRNFVLAGDWTDTKLPATIEGAIKSGIVAADFVMNT